MVEHDMVVTETDVENVLAVECTCGYRRVAYHGEAHADQICEAHMRNVGVKMVRLL